MSITFTYDKGIPDGGEDGDYGSFDADGEYTPRPALFLQSTPTTVSTGALLPNGVGIGGEPEDTARMLAETGTGMLRLPFFAYLALGTDLHPVARLVAAGFAVHAVFGRGGLATSLNK